MFDKMVDEWRGSGVCAGDVLLVHSNIKNTFRRYLRQGHKFTPDIILSSFLEALGPKGTLLLPLYNFDFTRGVPFDINTCPSHMGALTEAGRAHPEAVRTGHPIYSFAVIGARASEFAGIDNFSGYGANSPFAKLRELNGKIAVLDLPDQNSMTFYHHVEEMHEVDYRYHKIFTGAYTNSSGQTTNKKYGLFVRNIERNILTHVNPAGDKMWEAGLYKGDRPKEGCGLRTVSAVDMYDFVSEIITSGNAENMLFQIGNNE